MNRKLSKDFLVGLILTVFPFLLCAQGCSDAGFCTMGAIKPSQHFSRKINPKFRSAELVQYIGVNPIGDVILSYTADINVALSPKYTVQVKLPYTMVFGLLANTNGMGDISLSASRNLITKEKYQLNFTAGTKIPTNDGKVTTKRNNEVLPLPAYYQSSLGTYDVIGGLSFMTKRWLFATGYQQALNSNSNEFLWGKWNKSGHGDSSIAQQYPVSKKLHRGKDVMLRVERNFRLARFNAHIGLLGIYRLTEDKFINKKDIRVKQEGTTGLALSGVVGLGYNFSTHSGIKFIFARLLYGRYRTETLHGLSLDGLSRKFVNTISYEYRF